MGTFDIILDENGFIEVNGDFKTGENDNNLISYIVLANKGEYKEFPTLGVGIDRYLNGTENIQQIESNIIQQISSDKPFPNPDVDMSEYPSTIKINKQSFGLV
jgi:hypothetical protein